MLVIDPEVCIDCGLCIPDCPINAIKADTEPDMAFWVEHNQTYSQLWARITKPKAPPADAKQWEETPDKLRDHFSKNRG